MGYVEQMFLIACLKNSCHDLGLGTAETLGERLAKGYPPLPKNAAIACLRGKFASDKNRPILARAALDLLSGNQAQVMEFIAREGESTRAYLRSIIDRHLAEVSSPPNAPKPFGVNAPKPPWRFADSIFRRWQELSLRADGLVGGEIYQLFRRYKPAVISSPGQQGVAYDWSQSRNQVVVLELIYVDPTNLECILITSESNIYLGTIFISDELVSNAILQRQAVRRDGSTGTNHRFLAMRLEQRGRRMAMYSGLCMKTGDTFRRPVAAECVYVGIPHSHTEVYQAIAAIRTKIKNDGGTKEAIPIPPIVREYLSDNPPSRTQYDPASPGPRWRRVKFVRDFPTLEKMAEQHDTRVSFREPLRTISAETIIELSLGQDLTAFRWDTDAEKSTSAT